MWIAGLLMQGIAIFILSPIVWEFSKLAWFGVLLYLFLEYIDGGSDKA